MFESERLIYIQMQKTGCTHIAAVLSRLFDGRSIGKHNAATQMQLRSGKFFISSIRNPWDWYVSLWSYGVQGNGALMRRLARRDPVQALADIRKDPIRLFKLPYLAWAKDIGTWRGVYDRSDNVASFRRWLKLIHEPRNRPFLAEGAGDPALSGRIGFMTARYLDLCCRKPEQLGRPGFISDYRDLEGFDRERCYIDYFIRQEALEEGLCEAIERIRPLTPDERELVFRSSKSNTSRRSFAVADYYDEETTALVANRDRLLIEKFGYVPPLPQ
ncbi:hypothetical protein PC39_02185 [Salinisphaera sp. PC39]|uniref:hypothetical protein n=1 Tax=Salinisphaera sp. PC39 TaxID=1304156 RepID=UPI0033416CD2